MGEAPPYPPIETPPAATAPSTSSKRKTRRLYIFLGLIAVGAVVTGLALVIFSVPSFKVTISSSPSGGNFILVDGNPVTTPCNFSWQSGSVHNITANSQASALGVQYAYSSWSDRGAQSHIITINQSGDFNASFLTLIPLIYNYVTGEQMTYNMSSNDTQSSVPIPWYEIGNITLNVASFDGENYTIKERVNFTGTSGSLLTAGTDSETFELNRTGYLTNIPVQIASLQSLVFLSRDFTPAFEQNETEAGSAWQIPLEGSYQDSNMTMAYSGNYKETFSDIQNLTVPAGTYCVFRVDISVSSLSMRANSTVIVDSTPQNTSVLDENISLNCYAYLEYGTNRIIKMNLQMSSSNLQNGQTTSDNRSQEIELINDTEKVP